MYSTVKVSNNITLVIIIILDTDGIKKMTPNQYRNHLLNYSTIF